jgi:hypothetical protein
MVLGRKLAKMFNTTQASISRIIRRRPRKKEALRDRNGRPIANDAATMENKKSGNF